MSTSCNIRTRTTCRRTTVVQQQDLPAAAAAAAAAAEACSISKVQKQQAAESTNKQKCGLSCALVGTRWNQQSHFFVVLLVRDQASSTTNEQMKNQTKLLLPILVGQTDLASCSLRISITTRPAAQSQLHSNDQGKVQP